jgi:hypothetical protein
LEWRPVFESIDFRENPQSGIYLGLNQQGLEYRVFDYFPHQHFERSEEEYGFEDEPSLDQLIDASDGDQVRFDGGVASSERLIQEYVEGKQFVDEEKPYWMNLTGGTTFSGELRYELENYFPEAHYKKAIDQVLEDEAREHLLDGKEPQYSSELERG